MKKQYIGIIRDHSASMGNLIHKAAIDYNTNIKLIKENSIKHDIDTIVSVLECGIRGVNGKTVNKFAHQNSSVHVLKDMNSGDYRATGGSTPLFDAVDMMIDSLKRVPDANEPDVSFMVIVITDGGENSSTISPYLLKDKMDALIRTDKYSFVFRVPKGYAHTLVNRLGVSRENIQEWEVSEKGFEASTATLASAYGTYYKERAAGATKTTRFFADMSDVKKKDIVKNLKDITKELLVYNVTESFEGWQIRDFVEQKTKKSYVKGQAYYLLMKTEEVQDYKNIIIVDKKMSQAFSGLHARDLLGLPDDGTIKLSPKAHPKYDIFIQSTSVNRKVKGKVIVWKGFDK